MNIQGRIQKWGNSSAIRLPARALAAAGITPDSEVDIRVSSGQLLIQPHEKALEASLDAILADIPNAEELLKTVQAGLDHAIALTTDATQVVEESRQALKQGEK